MSHQNGENQRKRPRLEDSDEFLDEDLTAEEFDSCLNEAIFKTKCEGGRTTSKRPAQPNFSLEGEVKLLRSKVASLSRELHGERLARQEEIHKQTEKYKKQISQLEVQLEFKEHQVKATRTAAVNRSPKKCDQQKAASHVPKCAVDARYWEAPAFCIRPKLSLWPTYFHVIRKHTVRPSGQYKIEDLDSVEVALQSLATLIDTKSLDRSGVLQTICQDVETKKCFLGTIVEVLSGTAEKSGIVFEALSLIESLCASSDEAVGLIFQQLRRDSLLSLVNGTFGEHVTKKGIILLSAGIEHSCVTFHSEDSELCLWQAIADYFTSDRAMSTLCGAATLVQRGSETDDTCDCFHRLVETVMLKSCKTLSQAKRSEVIVLLNCLCSVAQSMAQYQLDVCRLVALCRDIPEYEEAVRDVTKVWDFTMGDREVYIGCGSPM